MICQYCIPRNSFGGISVCIIDEATQCTEAESIIPLLVGVETLILVGDTKQLPATILSRVNNSFTPIHMKKVSEYN